MESFFSQAWQFLLNIYYYVASAGYVGSAVALVSGFVLYRRGISMTGQRESYTGRQGFGDNIDITHHAAIKGTANGFIGKMFGTLLTWSGLILIVIAVIALANISVYGIPRGYN